MTPLENFIEAWHTQEEEALAEQERFKRIKEKYKDAENDIQWLIEHARIFHGTAYGEEEV